MEEIVQALSNIGFDWRVALANFVNFLIVFYLLNRFVFKPMARTLGERRLHIKKGVENAQKAETALVSAREEQKKIVRQARAESNEIVSGAREKEREIVIEAEQKAVEKAQTVLEEARVSMLKEQEKMKQVLHKEAAMLVVQGVRQLLKDEVTPEKGEHIISNIVRVK